MTKRLKYQLASIISSIRWGTEIMNSKRKPIENHKTAAWANIRTMKKNSCVTIPSEDEVINAKEYVDENKK